MRDSESGFGMTKGADVRPTYREVLDHIREHRPRCPASRAHQIILRVLSRRHRQGASLGQAVGMAMQIYIRHTLTNYDNLLVLRGLPKAEARAMIKKKIRKTIAKWDRPKQARVETVAMDTSRVLEANE
jgi:hypothetical protein